MTNPPPKKIALVLAGAVAQGAFEVGALQALARTDVDVVRIVAASSGALNGTVFAAGVRQRDPKAGAETLAELWRDHAAWNQIFHVSLADLVRRDGASDQQRLVALLRSHVAPVAIADPAAIQLRLIVAAMQGCAGAIGSRPATTFESVRDFDSGDFATAADLERVFTAAVASAALPLVFAPVEIDGIGPCVDGGTVNNTPMKWALDGAIGAAVDAIVVVATSVENAAAPPDLSGLTTRVGHLVHMLIEERLYRDLREAEQVNAALGALDRLVRDGAIAPAQLAQVTQALGWGGRRVVEIIQIRPAAPLRGNAFAGFFDGDLRREYLDAGFTRALEVLGSRRWPLRPDPVPVAASATGRGTLPGASAPSMPGLRAGDGDGD